MDYYIYARKSTESEDRQVLSIEAQIKELKALALNQGLNVVDVFSEAKSAKAPGRNSESQILYPRKFSAFSASFCGEYNFRAYL